MKKRKVQVGPRIRGTYHLSKAGVECEEVRSRILQRRLQVLVHSCIYYDFDNNLISDKTWERWARELVQLQKDYPEVAARVDYAEEFKDFDASTGFDLPHRNPEIMAKARWLMERSIGYGPDKRPNPGKSRGTVIRVKIP